MADYRRAMPARGAPLIVKDKIIVGIAGGEFAIRGFLDAYDVSDRQARVALLDGAGARRARAETLAERCVVVGARRRADLAVRLVRSRS